MKDTSVRKAGHESGLIFDRKKTGPKYAERAKLSTTSACTAFYVVLGCVSLGACCLPGKNNSLFIKANEELPVFKIQGSKHPLECKSSDDPDYDCLLNRPSGAFEDEFTLYINQTESTLAVKMVVPNLLTRGTTNAKGIGAWASIGFSPDGRMAGPSEAVVGNIETAGLDDPSVLRYRMDGYSPSNVRALPYIDQVLEDVSVVTTAGGALIVRFKRPLRDPSTHRPSMNYCMSNVEIGAGVLQHTISNDADFSRNPTVGLTVPQAEAGNVDCNPAAPHIPIDENVGDSAECEGNVPGGMSSLLWMNPFDEDTTIIWAYGSSPWPSYHDATGSFVLPRLEKYLSDGDSARWEGVS